MTAPQSRRTYTSPRSTRARFTPTLCALLLCLSPLAAQQPSAAASVGTSPAHAGQQEVPTRGEGPVLSSSENAQGAMLLHFTRAEGGLRLKCSGRSTFEIAGADHIWFPADAHLVNGVVVVSTSLVQQPIAVRYSWSNLEAATLFDSAGLPAAPFHTDQ